MSALPAEFLNQMREMLGDETPAFLRAMDDPPALPHNAEDFPDAPIIIDDTGKEG